jgi:5-methylcytosine-specific restriction endonuclease McrBC regulatory subunit McrC
MLRVHGESNSIIIDPYHKGVVRSDRDLKRYLRENGVNFDPAYLRDAPEGVFLRRQVANLARSTELRGLHTQSRELMKALAFLERRSVRVAKTT